MNPTGGPHLAATMRSAHGTEADGAGPFVGAYTPNRAARSSRAKWAGLKVLAHEAFFDFFSLFFPISFLLISKFKTSIPI
jgi:hypothetical protein